VLNEFIYTPGQVQTALINVAGVLKKTFDLTPYDQSPDSLGLGDQYKYDANNSDDILFGGLDDDFIHGAVGEDAMGGNEALLNAYMQTYFPICDQQINCANGLVRTDWTRPYNPGDILHFGSDTNTWHLDHRGRSGEFFLYDEFDARRAILFDPVTFQVWKTGAAPTSRQYFLNFDATDGTANGRLVFGCVQLSNNGTCLASANRATDGDDVLFGDLGNDWQVGGTGKDTIFAGYGNDISMADDDLSTNGWLNDTTDTHPTYADRVYGGGGIDILYGNTEADRLIDWVGEYDSYVVPFSPFGIGTVSRQVEPSLPEFLYALSRSMGVDMTRAVETGASVARNGEPYGELGLVIQQDQSLWQVETGGPTDPQSGGIPGGKRDTLRAADFNQRDDLRVRRRQRLVLGPERPARRAVDDHDRRRGRGLLPRRVPADLLRDLGIDHGEQAARGLQGRCLRHLRLLLADRLQVRGSRHLDEQVRAWSSHGDGLDPGLLQPGAAQA
jgi:hypothetical protein